MSSSFRATVAGLDYQSTVSSFIVRGGPGTTHPELFKVQKGVVDLLVLEVRRDEQNTVHSGNVVHQWLRLAFPDGQVGWVRDHVLVVTGDGSPFGYGMVTSPTYAYLLRRDESRSPSFEPPTGVASAGSAPPQPASEPSREAPAPPAPAPMPPAPSDRDDRDDRDDRPPVPEGEALARVRQAAFAITAAWEGGSYAAYNNYDAGIVSYGIIQFTLASGSLFTVVDEYLKRASSPRAEALCVYHTPIHNKEASLRENQGLRQALVNAAQDPLMQQVQDEQMAIRYWTPVYENFIQARGLRYPLSYALLFDMGVQHGTGHGFVRKADRELGVPERSRPHENGITEKQLISKVIELRQSRLREIAAEQNLPGVARRGDFWMELLQHDDWLLQGDAGGNVNVLGRAIRVREV